MSLPHIFTAIGTYGSLDTDVISLTAGTVYRSSLVTDDGYTVITMIYFNSDGTITTTDNQDSYTATTWGTSSGTLDGSKYEIKADFVGGFAPSIGATGEWLSLSSVRGWGRTDGTRGDGARSTTLDFSIRNSTTQSVVAGPTRITITAEWTGPTGPPGG